MDSVVFPRANSRPIARSTPSYLIASITPQVSASRNADPAAPVGKTANLRSSPPALRGHQMTKRPSESMRPFELDNSALKDALDRLEVPSYVLDTAGIVRWTSTAAKAIFGDRLGESYLVSIADEDRDRAKERFARRIFGVQGNSYEIAVSNEEHGRVRLQIHSTPLRAGSRIVGIFGLA